MGRVFVLMWVSGRDDPHLSVAVRERRAPRIVGQHGARVVRQGPDHGQPRPRRQRKQAFAVTQKDNAPRGHVARKGPVGWGVDRGEGQVGQRNGRRLVKHAELKTLPQHTR